MPSLHIMDSWHVGLDCGLVFHRLAAPSSLRPLTNEIKIVKHDYMKCVRIYPNALYSQTSDFRRWGDHGALDQLAGHKWFCSLQMLWARADFVRYACRRCKFQLKPNVHSWTSDLERIPEMRDLDTNTSLCKSLQVTASLQHIFKLPFRE